MYQVTNVFFDICQAFCNKSDVRPGNCSGTQGKGCWVERKLFCLKSKLL